MRTEGEAACVRASLPVSTSSAVPATARLTKSWSEKAGAATIGGIDQIAVRFPRLDAHLLAIHLHS